MASVRMTKNLRSSILNKFREALVATTQNNPDIVNLGDKLYEMVHSPLEVEWLQLTEKLINSYDGSAQKRKNMLNQRSSEELVVILCPNHIENLASGEEVTEIKNFSIRDNWTSKDNKYSGRRDRYPGEVGVQIPMSGEKPMIVNQNYWYSSYDNQTSIQNGFCITDKEIIKLVKQFSEGALGVEDSITTLDTFLENCTTLKKFLDEWPGAENIVPQEYIQQMLGPAKNTEMTHKSLIAAKTLDSDFKEQMNAAILTSKLTN